MTLILSQYKNIIQNRKEWLEHTRTMVNICIYDFIKNQNIIILRFLNLPALSFVQNLCLKYRSIPPEVFLGKGVLKICSKFTGEHPCRSEVSINLNFEQSSAASKNRKIRLQPPGHRTSSELN